MSDFHEDATRLEVPESSDPSTAKTMLDGVPSMIPRNVEAPRIEGVELSGELGRGGMGVVYRGMQPFLGRPVAVKCLHLVGSAMQENLDRFRREAMLLAELDHPHIVRCFQAGSTPDNVLYLVMELIDGPDLRGYIDKHGRLSQRDALIVVRQVAEALRYGHAKGIIHRDVKPQNILLKPVRNPVEGSTFPYEAKLADLGLARYQYASDAGEGVTIAGTILGTPSVMAPEQFESPDTIDHRADIYSLGCVLFHALTGRSAFGQKSISQIMMAKLDGPPPTPSAIPPPVNAGVDALVQRMLARKPEDRPQTYDELIGELRRLESELSAAAPTPKSSAMLPVGVLVACVGLVGAGWLAIHLSKKKPESPQQVVAQITPAATPAPTPAPTPEPTATPEPTPTPVPTASPTPVPFLYDEDGALLWRDGYTDRFADWKAESGASWGPEEDGEGIIGVGSGVATRALDAQAFQLRGGIATTRCREAGVGVLLESGKLLQLRIQNVDALHLARIEVLDPPDEAGARKLARVERAVPVEYGGDAPFLITVEHGSVAFQMGGTKIGTLTCEKPVTGVAASVVGGEASLHSWTLHLPVDRQ